MTVPVAFAYDVPLPNRYAATLQFLRTAAAMAAGGRRTAFLHGEASETSADTLARMDLAPGPNLVLRSIFAPTRLPGALARPHTALRIRRAARGCAVVSRGHTGMTYLPILRRFGAPMLLYEVHRLAGLSVAEAEAGGSLADDAVRSPEAKLAAARDLQAARAANGHVFLTDAVARAARAAGFPDRPALVLPSGTDLPPPPPPRPPDLDVIYAGKLSARKGLPDLLGAMAMLPERGLTVAGGSAAEVAALRNSAPPNVRFVGWQDQDDLTELLARARVGACLLPSGVDSVSDRFSSPMKLLQMMAHGLAVVATDTAAVRAVATDGRDALIVPPGDPGAAARAIDAALRDDALRSRLGGAARETAARYAWPERAERLGRFVDGLADEAR